MKQLRKSLYALTQGGIYTTATDTFVTGPIIIGFAILLGAGDLAVSLLGAIPFVGNLMHLFSSYLLEKGHSFKKLSLYFSFASRPFYLFIVLTPFIFDNQTSLILLLFFITLSTIMGGIAGGVWLPWIHAMIPSQKVGDFLAHRFQKMMLAKLFCFLISLIILNFFTQTLYAYLCLFLCAFITSLWSSATFFSVQDCPAKIEKEKHFFLKLKTIKKNRYFTHTLMQLSGLQFILNFLTPFITVFLMTYLGLSIQLITFFLFLQFGSYAFFIKKVSAHKKYTRLLKDSLLSLTTVSILFIILCIPIHNSSLLYAGITLLHILMGIITAGIQLGTTQGVLSSAPPKNSSVFIAVSSCIRSSAAILGTLCGGFMLNIYKTSFSSLSVSWILFFISLIFLNCVCYTLFQHKTKRI